MNLVGAKGMGESIWLGWFLSTTLTNFADICELIGDADFAGFFRALQAAGYTGPIILETPLGPEPLATARNHRAFVKDCLRGQDIGGKVPGAAG